MSAIVNITCENDADFFRQFNYVTTDGDPINLTSKTMRMGIRKRAEDTAEQLLLTTDSGGGIVIVNAIAGAFTVKITQDQLVRLPVGDYEHSLILLDATSKQSIWSGSLTVNAGPSR